MKYKRKGEIVRNVIECSERMVFRLFVGKVVGKRLESIK
jgi:hypothetical protein